MANKAEFEQRHMMKEPPSREELKRFAKILGGVEQLVGPRSRSKFDFSNEEAVLTELLDKPNMLRRPILWDGKNLLVGFNEKEYTEFFS